MNMQVNVRLSNKMLNSIRTYSEKHGFNNVQEFIKETVREKLFDKFEISKREMALVRKLVEISEKKNLYGTEKELFKKLRKR